MKKLIGQIPVIGALASSSRQFVYKPQDWLTKRKLANINHPYGQLFSGILNSLKNLDADDGHDYLREIEKERRHMLQNDEPLVYEMCGEAGLYDKGASIRDACRVSKKPKAALFMYLLIRYLKPTKLIELGTNVGISSAYQAVALKLNGQNGQLVTLDVSPSRLRLAKELHKKLGLENIAYVQGLFEDTLERTLIEFGPIDFSFIDGYHQYQPTLDYFNTIYRKSLPNSIFVFDDIRWSDGMKHVWREIQSDRRIFLAVDLNTMGVCFSSSDQFMTRYILPTIHYALL
jgi:predicted O-methyltransferase YrrM